jgi:hypothetical protein
MKNKFVQSLIIALIYWLPATLILFDIMTGDGMLFPGWVDDIFMPGFIIGFLLAFGGGEFAGFLGQLISLAIILAMVYGLVTIVSEARKNNEIK